MTMLHAHLHVSNIEIIEKHSHGGGAPTFTVRLTAHAPQQTEAFEFAITVWGNAALADALEMALTPKPLCEDCDEQTATETWDNDAPIPTPPPALHLCAPCADARRDRAAEKAAEEAA